MKRCNNNILLCTVLLGIILFQSCIKENHRSFKNLNFNSPCASLDSLCNWQSSYQVRTKIAFVKTSKDQQNYSLLMECNDGVGFLEQSYTVPKDKLDNILKLSAQIKTENLVGKGAGLNVGIYDSLNNLIQSVDMGYGDFNFLKNSTDWEERTIETIIPLNAETIKIGIISYGTGKAFFDDAKVNFTPLVNRKPSKLAKEYIDAAADSIIKNSLYKDTIEIASIKEKAYSIAGDAKDYKEVHLAIEYMLNSIDDIHALFMPLEARKIWEGNDEKVDIIDIRYSISKSIKDFGYIDVPGFHSNDSLSKIAFADTIQKQIKFHKNKGVKGWIVDLRNNDGGNMAPMLAGLEPLFSADTLGFLINNRGEKEYWGRSEKFQKEYPVDYVKGVISNKRITNQPIAVLYGNRTGSSGEIIIISFIGNDNTRSFGQKSYGLTTGNGEYKLADGSYMLLSSTFMAARNGKVYKSNILPDVQVGDGTKDMDEELMEAVLWLKSQL